MAVQLIHMDLKSKNVLLNARKDLAKIADVGLSRIIQSTLGGAGSTPFGVGTFEYTAPEILLGQQCNEKVSICTYTHVYALCMSHRATTCPNLTEICTMLWNQFCPTSTSYHLLSPSSSFDCRWMCIALA